MDRACEFDQDACKLERRWNHFVPSDNETCGPAKPGPDRRLHADCMSQSMDGEMLPA